MKDKQNETIADIVSAMRNGTIPRHRTDHELLTLYADRIEAAWKRERDSSEDETLVKSCNTCKHLTRKRKWCRVHDYSPHDPSKLPLIWPNGPCPQWECKYNSNGGVE